MIKSIYSVVTKYRPVIVMIFIILLITLALFGLYYINEKYILQRINSDGFYINWISNRNFIREGTSPYGDLATLRIQLHLYGHPATGDEPPVRYSYPLTSLLIFWPFALLPDPEIAKSFWLIFQEILLGLIVYFSLRVGRQKVRLLPVLFLLPTLIGFVFIFRSLFMGNLMILSVFSLVMWLFLLETKSDEVAGIFLAISTINLMSILPIFIGILIWTVYNRRWKHMVWFIVTSVISGAFIALFSSGWVMEYFQSLIASLPFPPYISIIELLKRSVSAISSPLAYVISGAAIIIFIVEMVLLRKSEMGLSWLMILLFTISQLFGLPTKADGLLIFYPILIISLSTWLNRGGWSLLFVVIIQLVVVVLPWLGVSLWRLGEYQVPILDRWVIIMPLISIFILYWIRWWMVKPPRVMIDMYAG